MVSMSEFPMRCAITGIALNGPSDGIWDDGEWISWYYINQQLAEQEGYGEEEGFQPYDRPLRGESRIGQCEGDVIDDGGLQEHTPIDELDPVLFKEMVALLVQDEILEEISNQWGEIGEKYLERHYGIKLSRPYSQGHDGHIERDLVEIKTISPAKKKPFVRVKKAGNFNVLAVVRIHPDLHVEVRFLRRTDLPSGKDPRYYFVRWKDALRLGGVRVPARSTD